LVHRRFSDSRNTNLTVASFLLVVTRLARLSRTERGYPLIIEATKVVMEESPVNREMIEAILPKLDYSALVGACQQLTNTKESHRDRQQEQKVGDSEETGSKEVPTLPDQVPELPLDDGTVAMLHRVLFDIHVLGGHLVCPDTGRRFPIHDGIPNMILHEDEL
jgi:multifunctional methyltransferase subunit TRM112